MVEVVELEQINPSFTSVLPNISIMVAIWTTVMTVFKAKFRTEHILEKESMCELWIKKDIF